MVSGVRLSLVEPIKKHEYAQNVLIFIFGVLNNESGVMLI